MGAENSFDLLSDLDYIYGEILKLKEKLYIIEKEKSDLLERIKELERENETLRREKRELLEAKNCYNKEEDNKIIENNRKLEEALKKALDKINFLLSS